jgi:hypothetical protein
VTGTTRVAPPVARMTLALLTALTMCSPLAFGAAKQQNMPVRSQVAVNCSFQTSPSLNFLGYDPNGVNSTVPLDQTTLSQISARLDAPSPSPLLVSLGPTPVIDSTARIERYTCSLQVCLFSLQ